MCCRGWRVWDPAAQIDTFRDKNNSVKVAQIASRGER